MYKVPNNENGIIEHFREYAGRLKTAAEEVLSKRSILSTTSYIDIFLRDLVACDERNPGTESLLRKLLIGDFSKQKELIAGITAELKKSETSQPHSSRDFISEMDNLFVKGFYENLKKFDKNKHIERVGIEVCPYCGRNYIYSVERPTISNPHTRVKPQIDHFLPKSKYPYLALNYYNLVPSCPSCNQLPCKWNNNPIGDQNDKEYLMHPYEFRDSDIKFSYIPTTSMYNPSSVTIQMACKNADLDKGYKEWLVLDKLYGKHNSVVSRMYVQLESIISISYGKSIREVFRVKENFLEKLPQMLFGYDMDDAQAPYITLHKFNKDIFKQLRLELESNEN